LINPGKVWIEYWILHPMNLQSDKNQLSPIPTINQEFSRRALAAMFHTTPRQFFDLLDKEGNLFLRFYWNEAGKRLGIKAPNPPFGLNYIIKEPSRYLKTALISLPAPVETGDSYLAALVFRPLRVLPFSFIQDRTAIFLLEKTRMEDPDVSMISRITRRFQREELGAGTAPQRDEFYNRVIEILEEED
jgi:hypothetical protein